jgi:hypothetical protein
MCAWDRLEEHEIVGWDAGIDWITCTWRDDDPMGAAAYVRRIARDAAHSCDTGTLGPQQATLLGYKGTRCGRTFVGSLPGQGTMLVASGATAHWLCAEGRIEPDNVSRIDVQVTYWSKNSVEHLPEETAKASVNAKRSARGRPWGVRLVRGFGDGDTAYLGSRNSDSYCRCYDKGRESGEPRYNQAIRYEVEFKRRWASRCHADLLGHECSRSRCIDIVAATYAARGVELPIVRPIITPFKPQQDVSEDEVSRRLRWYSEQVAPSIAKLLLEGVPHGTIIEALGLERTSTKLRLLGED